MKVWMTTHSTSSITWTSSLNITGKCQTGEAASQRMLAVLCVQSWLLRGELWATVTELVSTPAAVLTCFLQSRFCLISLCRLVVTGEPESCNGNLEKESKSESLLTPPAAVTGHWQYKIVTAQRQYHQRALTVQDCNTPASSSPMHCHHLLSSTYLDKTFCYCWWLGESWIVDLCSVAHSDVTEDSAKLTTNLKSIKADQKDASITYTYSITFIVSLFSL